MKAAGLIGKLDSLGISMSLDGDVLVVKPASRIPPNLILELKQHKPEIADRLR